MIAFLLASPPTAAYGACDPASAVVGVVLNEFLANPSSTDTDREWVEIHNGSGRRVDLSGWVVAAGTSSFGLSDPIPGGTSLAAGGYLVVGGRKAVEADLVVDGISLGNASSNADAVQLRDCLGGVADTVVYGSPNTDGWTGDRGDTTLAPPPPDGNTLGRMPDGSDTNRNATDVVELPYPTPGRANDAPPDTCGGPGSGLVVNEIFPDPDGTDAGFEWVELFHGGAAAIDLTGWSLRMGTSSLAAKYTWASGTIRPGERLLIGGPYVTNADLVAETLSLGNATSNSDAVAVVDCLGFASDTLVYGGPNDDEFVDDTGEIATRLAPSPGEASSIQRARDGLDTDDNAADWVTTSAPTPGAPNPEVEPVDCVPTTDAVRINEFVSDPDGTDEGFEWVELFNRSSKVVSVDGWGLSFGTSDFDSLDVVFGGGVDLAPGGFLVVGGEGVPEADLLAAFSIGNGTETDGIRLVDCEGTPVDTVLYGDAPNLDLMPDDRGDVVDPYVDPGSNEAGARVSDGADTNERSDWTVTDAPTPGAPNPVVEPVVCEPSNDSIRINEFVSDPDGTDEGLEWIELHNRSSSTVSVDGWGLSLGTSDFDSLDIVLPGGLDLPPNGFLVIGGDGVEEAMVMAEFSLGNGTETDGIRLFDCEGTPVDTVLYGDAPNLDLLPDDEGEVVDPYVDPGSNEAGARVEDGVDTNGPDDWKVVGITTPGASNVRELGTIDDPLAGKGGCGNKGPPTAGTGPQAGDPDGGCDTTSRTVPLLASLLVAALARRRRR